MARLGHIDGRCVRHIGDDDAASAASSGSRRHGADGRERMLPSDVRRHSDGEGGRTLPDNSSAEENS
jgi:hypothetical protein